MQIKASVVVTAFDRKEALLKLLNGLNSQTAHSDEFEVIIADDSAEMNVADKALESIDTKYRISVVKTGLPYDVNGVSVARNMGIIRAIGDIIISIDDDCIPNRYFVEEHLLSHKTGYPVIVLGHRSEAFEKLSDKRPLSVTGEKALHELIAAASDQLNFFNFMTGNISFPKRIVMEAGLFDESFAQPGEHGWEDIELGYRLWRLGYRTIFSRNAFVYRPPTERIKEETRKRTNATRKALNRFIGLHPLTCQTKEFFEATRQNDNAKAKDIAVKILAEDPDNHGILVRLGEIYLSSNEIDNASACFQRALRINKHNPVVFEKLGETLYRQSQHEEALQSFIQALEFDPNRTRSLYYVALLKSIYRGNGLHDHILSRDINLELGGGIFPTKIRQEGQDDYINVDIMDWPSADMVADLRKPLPFPDESVNRIFSREVIEHLPFRSLSKLIQECFRVLKSRGELYICCPDFEAIMDLYDKKCVCIINGHADRNCPNCHGKALISEDCWRNNLLGHQSDYGDGSMNDTHKNQISFPYLNSLLTGAGFIKIERDYSNRFYDEQNRMIKLSVSSVKP